MGYDQYRENSNIRGLMACGMVSLDYRNAPHFALDCEHRAGLYGRPLAARFLLKLESVGVRAEAAEDRFFAEDRSRLMRPGPALLALRLSKRVLPSPRHATKLMAIIAVSRFQTRALTISRRQPIRNIIVKTSAKTQIGRSRKGVRYLKARASEAEQIAKAARLQARMAKAEMKAARKSFKHAKDVAKLARKKAKAAARKLKSPERGKPRKRS